MTSVEPRGLDKLGCARGCLLVLELCWGSCFCQRMLCFHNSFKILLSPCSGMAGMRKWLLILVQGWRNLPGGLWAEEVPEMKMQSPRDWRLFVFPAGMMGHGQAPTYDLLHPDSGELSDRSLRLLQPA